MLAWLLRCSVAARDGWQAMKGSFLGEGNQKRKKEESGVEVAQNKEGFFFYKQYSRAFMFLEKTNQVGAAAMRRWGASRESA